MYLSTSTQVGMNWMDITLIIVGVVVAIFVILYFVGRKLQKKAETSQEMINQNKMNTSILVIDKKKMKITESNLPKMVIDQVPKIYRLRKMPLVKAKIGPKITTLICDPTVFKTLPTKKQVKVELAGLYITGYKDGKKGPTKQAKKSKWKFWQKDS